MVGWSPRPTLAVLRLVGTRQDECVLSLTTVRVVGPSMEPALRNGEWWIVRRGAAVRPGDVIMMRHPQRPHLTVVKRVERRADDGWWVLGDNPEVSDDSRQYGSVPDELVIGRLFWRYRPLRRS